MDFYLTLFYTTAGVVLIPKVLLFILEYGIGEYSAVKRIWVRMEVRDWRSFYLYLAMIVLYVVLKEGPFIVIDYFTFVMFTIVAMIELTFIRLTVPLLLRNMSFKHKELSGKILHDIGYIVVKPTMVDNRLTLYITKSVTNEGKAITYGKRAKLYVTVIDRFVNKP